MRCIGGARRNDPGLAGRPGDHRLELRLQLPKVWPQPKVFRFRRACRIGDAPIITVMPSPLPRVPLSVAVITLNAAGVLSACLESAAFADDIVVLDCGSGDQAAALARQHGARVVDLPWRGFGPQKQAAVAAAQYDWVLCLDADERVTPALRASIEAALAARPAQAPHAYRMARANRFMGRTLRHGEGYPDWSLRLFHRGHARWSDDAVHEKVLADGAVGTLSGDLLHESAETLEHYLDKQNRYTSLAAERLFRAGRSAGWASIALAPPLRFVKFYVFRLGFLDGVPGLVHIAIGCANSMIKYAKLRSLNRP
jgi:glycosyltransferase involved in cell wall biosynthesis